MSELDRKESTLRATVAELGRVAVAFSGGTDSSCLLAVCIDVLGVSSVLAMTADSPLMPRSELLASRELAAKLDARHVVLPIDELDEPLIAANPPDRCYHCKLGRFQAMVLEARKQGFLQLVHGENADDLLDYRPGSRAAEELRVRAPLREAGFTKREVRELARRLGLPNWDQPANACLASRFPYGTALSRLGLGRVEAAEVALHAALNARHLRVRDHFPLARIEVAESDLERFASAEYRRRVTAELRAVGYRYVALDLEGYRMGSMHDAHTQH
jgi:uncharacterized protein